jgi:hypothetical protein
MSMEIGCIDRDHYRTVDFIKVVFVWTIEFGTVTVTGVFTVPSESINGDGFVVFHFRDEENRNKGFGEDHEKNFLLDASLFEGPASDLCVCKIDHSSMSVVVLDFMGSILGELHVH